MRTWIRRILGLIAIVGSVYGLTSSAMNIFALNATGGGFLAMAISALGVLFFLYGLMCGFWLLESTPHAVMANSFFWLAQVPAVVTAFLTYKVYAFGSMAFATDPAFSGFGFPTNGAPMGAPESGFNLSMGSAGDGVTLGINLFAIAMLVLLLFVKGGNSVVSSVTKTAKKGGMLGKNKVAAVAGGAAALTGAAAALGAKGASAVAEGAGGAMDTVGDVAGSVASNVTDAAGGLAGGAMDAAGSAVSGVADAAGSAVSGVADAAGSIASGVGDIAGSVPDVVGDVVGGAGDLAGDAMASVTTPDIPIIDLAATTADVTGGVATGVAETAGNLSESALDTAKEAASLIGGGIGLEDVKDAVIDEIKS